jgi:hypothetical protein
MHLTHTQSRSANSSDSLALLDLFKSGQWLALKPECRGGLIVQKSFYADFVGPGAAVGGSFDVNCTSVYVLGEVEFYAPTTYTERQHAFHKRVSYIKKLSEILAVNASIHRACLTIRQLCLWVGVNQTRSIPLELIAQLGGLIPHSVALGWRHLSTKHSARMKQQQMV